ncbi:hypothetical protein V438_16380 [Clostridioides difficile]|nr:hypothetical protein V439_03640 [Clostridioides difficile]PCN56008.1 hypothetical protein V438_16380 [Clostridioides difficile]
MLKLLDKFFYDVLLKFWLFIMLWIFRELFTNFKMTKKFKFHKIFM